ncbi:hypothetical protein F8388_025208 [Cannabis sativa]|uniref:Uncharacterized protein n=1 Tax=Cannabis sativa TaxID=3483 RepID=A0A7J6FS05_CANSA|nr:hypothetical protein F8388_025208 [Cannabis sativa]
MALQWKILTCVIVLLVVEKEEEEALFTIIFILPSSKFLNIPFLFPAHKYLWEGVDERLLREITSK